MCSKRCAKPVLPGFSWRLPTPYHTFTATIGARLSRDRITRRPFGSWWRSIATWGKVMVLGLIS